MNWGSAGNFFAMGGYGFYVWGSFGLSFLLIALEIISLAKRRRTLIERLGQMQDLEDEQDSDEIEA